MFRNRLSKFTAIHTLTFFGFQLGARLVDARNSKHRSSAGSCSWTARHLSMWNRTVERESEENLHNMSETPAPCSEGRKAYSSVVEWRQAAKNRMDMNGYNYITLMYDGNVGSGGVYKFMWPLDAWSCLTPMQGENEAQRHSGLCRSGRRHRQADFQRLWATLTHFET